MPLKTSWMAAAVTLGMAAAVHAQGVAEPEVDPPPSGPSPVPSTAVPPVKPGLPIAQPGPYAPPSKVQEAKETAK